MGDVSIDFYTNDYGACIPKYFRCIIIGWRVMSGWLRLLNKICLTISILLTGLATIPNFDLDLQTRLGIAAIVCQSIALFCETMRDYAGEAIEEHKKMLRETEQEENEDVPASLLEVTKVAAE